MNSTASLQVVRGENRVQQAVSIAKNAAQASASGVGVGPNGRSVAKKNAALGRRRRSTDVKPSTRFSGLRNPVFGANGLQATSQVHELCEFNVAELHA